jgi:hypothetical protein
VQSTDIATWQALMPVLIISLFRTIQNGTSPTHTTNVKLLWALLYYAISQIAVNAINIKDKKLSWQPREKAQAHEGYSAARHLQARGRRGNR